MSKNIRINIYIRQMTKKLLDNYCEINELDQSRAVDDLLYGRLKYLEEAEIKAKKHYTKEQTNLIKKYNVSEEETEEFFKWYNNQEIDNRNYVAWYWYKETKNMEKEKNK